MYLPAHFEETRPERLHALLRQHPLGLLITQDAQGAPVADALPWLLLPEPGDDHPRGKLIGHVARANPLWRGASVGREVLVVFQGPEGYVSPSGYTAKAEHGKVVPTWNYAMVQARGALRVLDEPAAALALVERLTEHHEALRDKPWGVHDAPADYIAAMLRAIVCIEIPLCTLVGKFKLGQHRGAADQVGVLDALFAGPARDQDLAALMQRAIADAGKA